MNDDKKSEAYVHKKSNDQIILEQIIKDKYEEVQDSIAAADFFEIFAASEVLKDQDLSYDEIQEGIVGNGGDGGIDSIFTFINGELLKEDSVINGAQKRSTIDLVIIQAKTSPNFKEDAVIKFRETAEDIFDLSNDLSGFGDRYNVELLQKAELFRKSYSLLARTFPKISIKFFYVTQGSEVHPNVAGKVDKLKECISTLFSGSEFSFSFVGASKLLEMTRNTPSTARIMEISESPISTSAKSYICLVGLKEYFDFISDNGNLSRSLFESNVRDYQGSVAVNTGIKLTLQNPASEDFWYLNNGVTIITPKAILAGKQLTIEDPQIVNGLQTSHEIYQHFSTTAGGIAETRNILVRVICESDESARDRIIRATNSQTSITPASLRSSDEIHRNIEAFLKANGYFYDRKKNFYKNNGKPISSIIGIPYIAQCMMSIVLQKPDQARARPSTLLNSDQEYRKIFSLDIPIDIYLKVIQIMKFVEKGLKDYGLDRKTTTNIKFYVAMIYSVRAMKTKINMVEAIGKVSTFQGDVSVLVDAISIVNREYIRLGATDQAAKGSKLSEELLKA